MPTKTFTVTVSDDSVMRQVAESLAPGQWSAPLDFPEAKLKYSTTDPFNLNPSGTEYMDCAGGTEHFGYAMSRAMIWHSKGMWHEGQRRGFFIFSPHPFDEMGPPPPGNETQPGNYNSFLVKMIVIDEMLNKVTVHEAILNDTATQSGYDWPRSVGHGFDNMCLVDDFLWKFTLPVYYIEEEGEGGNPPFEAWVQRHYSILDTRLIDDQNHSASLGAAVVEHMEIGTSDSEATGGAIDFMPPSRTLVHYHKNRVSFVNVDTRVVTDWITIPHIDQIAWHNVGHYNPISGKFIGGGGAKANPGVANQDFFTVDGVTKQIQSIDACPVCLSVNETNLISLPPHLVETKAVFVPTPGTGESIAFHDDMNIYAVDPARAARARWRLAALIPAGVGEVDGAITIQSMGVILTAHSRDPGGNLHFRMYKPLPAPTQDLTAPNTVTNLAYTGTAPNITLTWSPSLDPLIPGELRVGIALYRVRRNGTALTPTVAFNASPMQFVDNSAPAGASYTVEVEDASGNVSAPSNTVTLPTAGPTPRTVGVGKQHATITAALAAWQPGEAIEVYNGTYNETVISTRDGTEADPLILRAAAGQAPIITGFTSNIGGSGRQGCVYMGHSWLVWGEGITCQGNNSGTTSSWTASNPDDGVVVGGSARDCVVQFKTRGTTQSGVAMRPDFARIILRGVDVERLGTLSRGVTPIADTGEGVLANALGAGGPALIEDSRFAMGGHNAFQARFDPVLFRTSVVDQSGWEPLTFPDAEGQTTGLRNRCAGFLNGETKTVIEDAVFQRSGISADAPTNNPTLRISNKNTSIRRTFFFDNNSGGPGIQGWASPDSANAPGPVIRMAHLTFYLTNTLWGLDNNTAFAFGPFWMKNICIRSAQVSAGTQAIQLQYRSSRTPDWRTLIFIDGLLADADYNFKAQDMDGVIATYNKPLSQCKIENPNNFKNVILGVNPNFVSQVIPAANLSGPAALAAARANFLPTNPLFLGTGQPLTATTAASTGTTLQVEDEKWFRGNMGFGHLPGDTIYVEAVGPRIVDTVNTGVIVVTQATPVAAGARIWLGASDHPNIGAV